MLAYILVVTVVTYATAGYDPKSYPATFNTTFGWGTVLFIVLLAVVATMLKWRTEVDRFTPVPLEGRTHRAGEGLVGVGGDVQSDAHVVPPGVHEVVAEARLRREADGVEYAVDAAPPRGAHR